MIKIGVDARTLCMKPKGIATVLRNLLKAFSKNDSEYFFYLFVDEQPFNREELAYRNCKIVLLPQIKGERFFTWLHLALPKAFISHDVDLAFYPSNRVSFWQPKPCMTIVHDVKWFRFERYQLNKISFYKALKKSKIISTVSNFSKADIMDNFAIPEEKIFVVYNGIPDNFRPLKDKTFVKSELIKKYPLNSDFIFALGSPIQTKNTPKYLEAFSLVKRRTNQKIKLFIAGLVDSDYQLFLRRVAAELGILNDVVIAGYIEEGELVKIYNCATIFMYLSEYEGFGLPPLEAMACGAPVVASNKTSIPEVVGDTAVLVNPRNPDEIAEATIKLIESLADVEKTNSIIQKGLERAKLFSWQKASEQYLNLFSTMKSY